MARSPRRYAVVGTGARAEMFVRAIVARPAEAELVAFADTNPLRMRAHNRWLGELGHPSVPTYAPSQFALLLDRERVDVVVVTTVDATHDEYIVAALDAGRDVITEKPMTIDAPRCERLLRAVGAAADRGAGSLSVAFNYRYNPVHERVRELLAAGAVGTVGSVHFEWLLDVRHGADYFRRWHRDRACSGGLLVHKASHHFDLVNWWLGSTPVSVYADSRRFFYGPRPPAGHDYDRGYVRAHGDPAAAGDPFALDLAASPRLRELYLDAEAADGYLRDRNVFADGVSIDDDMAVLVRYRSGATMTYHLTAYAPWEGYRLMVNGSRGRLELDVVESVKGGPQTTAALHGVDAPVEASRTRLSVHPYWTPAHEIELTGLVREGHGGADARMTADLLDPGRAPDDALGRRAGVRDGAWALLTGVAANASVASGAPVAIADLLDVDRLCPVPCPSHPRTAGEPR
jgi:predicted dehydrogenase